MEKHFSNIDNLDLYFEKYLLINDKFQFLHLEKIKKIIEKLILIEKSKNIDNVEYKHYKRRYNELSNFLISIKIPLPKLYEGLNKKKKINLKKNLIPKLTNMIIHETRWNICFDKDYPDWIDNVIDNSYLYLLKNRAASIGKVVKPDRKIRNNKLEECDTGMVATCPCCKLVKLDLTEKKFISLLTDKQIEKYKNKYYELLINECVNSDDIIYCKEIDCHHNIVPIIKNVYNIDYNKCKECNNLIN